MKRRSLPISMLLPVMLLVCCSSENQSAPGTPANLQQTVAPEPINFLGQWRILAIDGEPPVRSSQSGRAPYIAFSENTAGGSVGCNSFGGLGLLADGHYAIHSWGGTAMGCLGALGDQERAVSQIFSARPAVTRIDRNRLLIVNDKHSLELEYLGPNRDPRVPAGSSVLAGTKWRVLMMDGAIGPENRYLRFSGDHWEATISCATLYGQWQREGDRLIVGKPISSTEQACPPKLAVIDAAFAEIMLSGPRFLVGPNGEILIAGAGHALTGQKIR